MSKSTKLLIGFVLGYFGYMALKKYQATKTVMVDSFDQPMPNVVDTATVAGVRG